MSADQRDVLACGCVLTYRESDRDDIDVALIFLTPCSQRHREVALRVRGSRAGQSSLVVRAVPS